MTEDEDLDLDDVTLFRDPVARKIGSTAFWDEIYGDGTAIEDRDKLRVLKAACDDLNKRLCDVGFFDFPSEKPELPHVAAEVVPIR